MSDRQKRTLILIGLTVLLILVLFFVPVLIPYTLTVPGKILPQKEWMIRKNNDGSLIVSLRNHQTGLLKSYSALQIERGDAIHFRLLQSRQENPRVTAGDTIAVIHSNELNFELTRLQHSLVVAKGLLAVNTTGEKKQIVEKAEKQYALALEKLKTQNRLFTRQDSLFRLQLTSREKHEIARSVLNIAQLEADIARAQLEEVKSGAKPEKVTSLKAEIRALENEIRVLQQRYRDFTLISPISGVVQQKYTSDTLLTVVDTTSVVFMPFKLKYFRDIAVGNKVVIKIPGLNKNLTGEIIRKDREAHVLFNEQVFITIARMESPAPRLPANMIVPCSIRIKMLRPMQYLIKSIGTLFK